MIRFYHQVSAACVVTLLLFGGRSYAQQPLAFPTPTPEVSPTVTPTPTPNATPVMTPPASNPAPPPDGLAALIAEALAANPELAALRREFDAARARIPQAQALPDPAVSFGNNTQTLPVPFTGLKGDFSEIYIGVSQDLPWFGVRRLRGQAASAAAEAKFAEYAANARRVAAEVKAVYYDIYQADKVLAVLARDKQILEKIAQVAQARYEVGQAQQVDLINAQVEITALLHQQGELEAQRAIALARLNQLLLRDPETPLATLAGVRLSATPPVPPLAELTRRATENAPELAQQRRLLDANNKALRLAERQAKYPEVGLNFTYHKRPAFDDYYTYGVTLRLPLYAYTKQRYAVEEQTANLAATQARLAAQEAMLRNRLREAQIRATTAQKLIKLLEEGLIPQGTLALESALSAYQVGQADFPTVLTALKRVLDYETRYYELLAAYLKAVAESERYTAQGF